MKKGPVSIGATLPVNPSYDLRGSQGSDSDAQSVFDGISTNQVNALWESSDTFRWQGSSEYQGNVSHARRRSASRAVLRSGSGLVRYHC